MTGDTVSELATNERLAAHIVSPAELHRQLFLAGRNESEIRCQATGVLVLRPSKGGVMNTATSAQVETNISLFLKRHFRHFNAATVMDASEAYVRHISDGGKMFMTLAGAMSTAELGISLAEMIRQEKVHAICSTGANLEEDVYNLVAHDHYERVPHYRHLTPEQEAELLGRHLNRVTDTCIPEEEAMRRIERVVVEEWREASHRGQRR